MTPLERIMKELEKAMAAVETKAGSIAESDIVQELDERIKPVIARLKEIEDDVGEMRGQFDARREPVQDSVDKLGEVGASPVARVIDLTDITDKIDALVTSPRDAARSVNTAFGDEKDD